MFDKFLYFLAEIVAHVVGEGDANESRKHIIEYFGGGVSSASEGDIILISVGSEQLIFRGSGGQEGVRSVLK